MSVMKSTLSKGIQILGLTIVFLFIGIGNAEADCDSNSAVQCSWYFNWSCPGCGKIGGATSGTQGPYSSASQCNSARGRIKSPVSAGSCYKRGTCNVTSPTPKKGPTEAEREAARKRKEKAEEEKKRKKSQQEAERRRRFNREKNEALKQLKGRIRDLDNDDSETIKLKSGTVFDTALKPVNTLKLKGTGKSVNTPTLKGTANSQLGLKQPRFSKGTRTSAPVSAEEYDAATGKAFTEAEELKKMVEATGWPVKEKSTFLLGVSMAQHGRYKRASSLFQGVRRTVPNEPWITQALNHMRDLQAVQSVRKGADLMYKVVFDRGTLGTLTKNPNYQLMIGLSLFMVGDFESGVRVLKKVRITIPTDRDLEDTESYMKQMSVQKRARESALSDQEKARRVATARANSRRRAAWVLGNHLGNYGDNAGALPYLKEAQKGFSPGSYEYRLLGHQIAKPDDFAPMPELNFYDSKAYAILDALQYGDGSWERSVRYLKVANKADPKNLYIRDALNYVQGMRVYAERDKK